MKIILASKSGVRKKILDKYNIDNEVIVSNVDEDEVKESLIAEGASPLEISKNQLKKRLSGDIGIDMRYSKESAFTNKKAKQKIIINQNKLNVLICTHCFFDNPHAYGEMFFFDFFEFFRLRHLRCLQLCFFSQHYQQFL